MVIDDMDTGGGQDDSGHRITPFADTLREFRLRRKITRADLAKQVGVSDRTIGAWERGESIPVQRIQGKLSSALGLDDSEARQLSRARDLMYQEVDEESSGDLIHPLYSSYSETRGRSVFLCHSTGDKQRVRSLYSQLASEGVTCWLDERDLIPGQDWDREIRKAIQSASFVLACLSSASITKTGYIQKELKFALDRADEQPEGSIFLIPVRLEECDVPDRLSHLQRVDLFADSGYENLLRALRHQPGR